MPVLQILLQLPQQCLWTRAQHSYTVRCMYNGHRQELCHETALIVLRIINEPLLNLPANSRIKDVEIFYAYFMYLIQ